MKVIILTLCLFSLNAFAENELAQALYSNSKAMTELQTTCGGELTEITSNEISGGIFEHNIIIAEFEAMVGQVPKCRVTIRQDFTPLMTDGEVAYQVDVKKL
jgi:hypothetical protein